MLICYFELTKLYKSIVRSILFFGRLTLSISLYFPISEWAVIRHPNTRNFPPGSEVFSSTFVQTCRALSVWLDWYNLRPFSICCLVWSWPISGARRLIKIFISLGHAISLRQQEGRSLPCTVQLQRSLEDDPLRDWSQKAYQIPLSQLRLCWDGEETGSTEVKRQHTKTIITKRFVESCRVRKIPSPFNPAMIPSHHQVFKNSPSDFRLKNAKETRFPVEC